MEETDVMGTVIVIAVLVIIVILAVRPSIEHVRGKGGCCGGGGDEIKLPKKKLDNPVIGKYIFYVDGMHCENCKNRIENKVNNIEGVSCQVKLKKKQAIISYDRDVDSDEIKSLIEKMDYTVEKVEKLPA